MYPYMIGEEDVGIYKNTYEHTLKNFVSKDPVQMARNSGTEFDAATSEFSLQSLGQQLSVQYPQGRIRFDGSDHMPLWPWRLIILNHLARADNAPPAGRLIPFRDLEGRVFDSAYYRMGIQPLIDSLADKPVERIRSACSDLGASLEEGADVCALFHFLPRFPVTLKIWLQDDELAGSANIIFDANANHYLHTEDVAAAASIVAASLISQYQLKFSIPAGMVD